jgi:hypothetical protein
MVTIATRGKNLLAGQGATGLDYSLVSTRVDRFAKYTWKHQ